ncbi:hypothetical protein OV208_36575 [Corallococcus sp. bb12-1]|uniref:hypothetical protein n=1 Tax=Corallococcus sp. bb12-1 TaxID=2996784 RepID=UPI002271DBA9|nr:hypothetical protein [Corallococcus sp. bb12-1]MCY1046878.1 hypothetical protein [Corallococcus sp. bb12-1]
MLVAALGFPVFSLSTGILSNNGHIWLLMVGLGALAAHHLASRWKVLLNLENRTLWRRTGYRESFTGKAQPLEPFTSVALRMRGQAASDGPFFAKAYSVALVSPARAVTLSHSDDREEALELAQAVSRFLGLGLSVEGGQSRPVTARLEEAPLTDGGIPALPSGSGIRFTQGGRGLTLELPPCGWSFVYAAQAALALLIGVGGPAFFLVQWSRTFGLRSAASTVPVITCAILVACGAFLFWRVARESTTGWTVIASSRGIQLTRHGPWRPRQVTRLPALRIQDIDLRDMRTETSRGRSVVIEHDVGIVQLGMDLSQAELEWTETVLRRALATPSKVARREAV